MKIYKVIREYWSGRKFAVGETITAEPASVAHLVGSRLKEVKPKKTKNDSQG